MFSYVQENGYYLHMNGAYYLLPKSNRGRMIQYNLYALYLWGKAKGRNVDFTERKGAGGQDEVTLSKKNKITFKNGCFFYNDKADFADRQIKTVQGMIAWLKEKA